MPEEREVRHRGDQAAGQDDRLAADLVRQRAEQHEAHRADDQRPRDEHVRGEQVDLQNALQEEQRVELARVPDHRLAGDEAEQRDDDHLRVLPLAEGFRQRRLGVVPSSFIFLNAGLSSICRRIQTEIASRKIERRKGMRQPHAANRLRRATCAAEKP